MAMSSTGCKEPTRNSPTKTPPAIRCLYALLAGSQPWSAALVARWKLTCRNNRKNVGSVFSYTYRNQSLSAEI